ncbi:M20/M25/M40 family metallo-hydrolase [Olivibacter sitiensis]|uniref:M20/M25/M40 family metallo-hydrolase n=1 Tax=Olivibacter sitiensis TaxID=376470 RepID=UPI000418A72B|nr:M20/M25/M40 family metallo-hydrolase [Olivibacter sitiensis]
MIKNNTKLFSSVAVLALFLLPQSDFAATKAFQDTTAQEPYKKQIAAIYKNKKVEKAFQHIDELEEETRSNHILLNEIAAPPFQEEKRADQYSLMLREIGVDSVWIDAAGNVIAKRKGTKGDKTIAIEGHLDTVFPEGTDVTVKLKGDTLAAPGVADNTRSLAALLTMLKAMNLAGIKTEADVLFIGTVGEEGQGDLRGMKELFGLQGPKIDTHIALDGTSHERIVNRGVGSHRYRVTFKSTGGHSYGSFGMVNTHVAMGKAINYWSMAADEFLNNVPGPKTTYSVSVLGGGTSVNSIPFESWMEVDMRSEDKDRLEKVDAFLKEAVSKAAKEVNASKRQGKDLEVTMEMIGDRPVGTAELTSPLVQRMMAVIELAGFQPKLGASSTNSNVPLSLGKPSITIGSGGIGAGAHSLDEWYVNKDGYLGIRNALVILLAEAGLGE